MNKCKKHPNEPQFIPKDIKKNIKQIGLEHGLFSRVILIQHELVGE